MTPYSGRTSSAGDNSYLMTGTGKITNRIQAFEADGFQVGSNVDVNESGTTFHYIAWAASPQVSTGSYTGNGARQPFDHRHRLPALDGVGQAG